MSNFSQHLENSDFQGLPDEVKLSILAKEDPEFAKLPVEVQSNIIKPKKVEWPVDFASANEVKGSGSPSDEFMSGMLPDEIRHPIDSLKDKISDPWKAAETVATMSSLPLALTAASVSQGKRAIDRVGKYVGMIKDAPDAATAAVRAIQAGTNVIPAVGQIGDTLNQGLDKTDPEYNPNKIYNAAGQLTALLAPEVLSGVSKGVGALANNRYKALFNNKSLALEDEANNAAKEFNKGGLLSDVFAFTKKGLKDQLDKLVNNQGKAVKNATDANSKLADALDVKIDPSSVKNKLRDLQDTVITPGTDDVPEPMIHNEELVSGANKSLENILNAFGGEKGQRSFADVHDMKVKQAEEAANRKYYGQDPASGTLAKTYGTTASGLREALNNAASQIKEQFPQAPDYTGENAKYSKLADLRDLYMSGNDAIRNREGYTLGRVAGSPGYGARRGLVEALDSNPGINLGLGRSSALLGRLASLGMPLAQANALAIMLGQGNSPDNTMGQR